MVVSNGPRHTSTKNSWSHVQWEMVPTPIQILTLIHRFIDSVDRSRLISTVDADSPTGEYGRYRRSMLIHLQRITVDCGSSIKNRHNFVVDFIDDTCVGLHSRRHHMEVDTGTRPFASFDALSSQSRKRRDRRVCVRVCIFTCVICNIKYIVYSSTQSFQHSYQTICYEVIKATSIKYMYIDVFTLCPGVSRPPLSTIVTLLLG